MKVLLMNSWQKNIGNASVVYQEVVENELNQFVDTFPFVNNIYDLVIIGKRQDIGFRFKQDMKPWVEFEELGIIGDMLASLDCEKMKSVLVIQIAGSVNGDSLGIAYEKSCYFVQKYE